MSEFPADHEHYPLELLQDEDNPANDAYFTKLRRLRAAATHLSSTMRARHVTIVRLSYQGRTTAEIAQETGVAPGTVTSVLRREDSNRLLSTLQHIGHFIDGPNLELRKNMLWRIARRNEEPEPTVTIAALKELNKLEGAYPVQSAPISPNINITFNQEALPRTALDGDG